MQFAPRHHPVRITKPAHGLNVGGFFISTQQRPSRPVRGLSSFHPSGPLAFDATNRLLPITADDRRGDRGRVASVSRRHPLRGLQSRRRSQHANRSCAQAVAGGIWLLVRTTWREGTQDRHPSLGCADFSWPAAEPAARSRAFRRQSPQQRDHQLALGHACAERGRQLRAWHSPCSSISRATAPAYHADRQCGARDSPPLLGKAWRANPSGARV